MHAPLFVVVLAFFESPAFRIGFDAFAIVHGIVHLGLRNHPLVEFDGWFSGVWIFGGALLAGLHLGLVF